MQSNKAARPQKPIRPAATLLIVRDGAEGVEVLALKRSMSMRFLPGYIAFPGGTLDHADRADSAALWTGTLAGAEQADDPVYAFGALRECAEEVGWLCGVQGGEVYPLSVEEQATLLNGSGSFAELLRARHLQLDGTLLRFVGRWVTPAYMPARFDTRFFVTQVAREVPSVRIHREENEWVRWCSASFLLRSIADDEHPAVPPTIAMLKGIADAASAEECVRSLRVPGPPVEEEPSHES